MNAIQELPGVSNAAAAAVALPLPGFPPILTAKPLRITHYLPQIRLEEGGVVRAILDWCAVLAGRGHQMVLLTCQGDDVPRDWLVEAPGKPRAHILPPLATRLKLLNRRSIRLISDVLARTDVLHLHGPWLPGNSRIAGLARRQNVPYVVSIHGMLDDWSMSQKPWKKKLFMSMTGRKFLQQASRIHCTAEGELVQAKKWIGASETAVIPCLTDLVPFETLPGTEAALSLLPVARRGDLKLLFLSRLHEKKGVDILIRAAAILRDAGAQFIVMIAGTGDPFYKDKLYQLVAELHLRDRVFFLGLVTGSLKLSVYQSADLFVLPTAQENFGLVLTEALACGTPVLTTRGTDIWPEVQAAGGEIADRTPEAIANAAVRLLNDAADRKARGIRGRDWTFANLAVDSVSHRYEVLYREMINAPR